MRIRETEPSETLAALQALGSAVDLLLSNSTVLPDEPETAKVLRGIGTNAVRPTAPPEDFLQKIRQQLVAASKARRLSALSSKELRYAPWLLWNGDPPAASLSGVLEAILDQGRKSGPTLRRVIQAYLRDFSPGAPGIRRAAEFIRHELASSDPRLAHWRNAQEEVQLLDPIQGPTLLAARLLEKGSDGVLARYRLDDPMFTTGGYMMAVEDAICAAAPVMLRDGGTAALARILKVIAPTENRLRFESRRAETARALLGAWLTGRGEPAAALQEPVRRHLLSWLGDPRLRGQAWAAVGEQETALVRRWLTRASLDLFFKLIDDHALDEHWRYRHAFWLSYLEKGTIADAWLALGRQAYTAAMTKANLGRAYGRLRGPGVTRDQSALLLRIGPLVIGEFTHNGKLRAWLADWREAPQLGRQEYSRYDLMRECLPFPVNPYRGRGGNSSGTGLSHINSQDGYWQGSVAALIESHIGVRTTPGDWRPR